MPVGETPLHIFRGPLNAEVNPEARNFFCRMFKPSICHRIGWTPFLVWNPALNPSIKTRHIFTVVLIVSSYQGQPVAAALSWPAGEDRDRPGNPV